MQVCRTIIRSTVILLTIENGLNPRLQRQHLQRFGHTRLVK
jgi:hypothetical protein